VSRSDLTDRVVVPSVGAVVLFGLLVGGGLLYAAGGGATRDVLVTQMLVNAILVVGLQIFIGNTGVLSFGHMGFAAFGAYVFALLAIEPKYKERLIPDAPLGIPDVQLGPIAATFVAVAVTLVLAFVIGLGLIKSGAKSGAVAATMITLALLFVAHEVARNLSDLTAGKAGLTFGPGNALDDRTAIFIVLLGAILVARLFRESSTGRLAQAAREDDLAARSVGINPGYPQMAALLLSVAVVTVGASLRTQVLGSISPEFFFFSFTLLTLTMLIVGGRNGVTGAVLGVAVITVGNEVTRWAAGPDVNVPGFDWILREGLSDLFLGGAMLLFMILRPRGILGDWEIDYPWRARRRAAEVEPARLDAVAEPAHSTMASEHVSVFFGGFRALQDVSIRARTEEVVGLIGPNGAGKTTLVNVLTGVTDPTNGVFSVDDEQLSGRPAYVIARAGLARTFQNLRLFPTLSVEENVAVAALVASRHRADRPTPDHRALLAASDLWDVRDRRAGELDYGASRKLELARAAALAPDFLLLDEPTSGLGEAESVAMIDHVRQMAAAVGAGVVVIDHDLHFITNVCDRIYVLDQGTVIAEGTPHEIQANERVQVAYLGSATPTSGASRSTPARRPTLEPRTE
jgi:branched-chain amino acid transport system permease protein